MKTQFGRKSKLLVIYVICFLGTLFFFQNCSQIKNAGLQAENGILMDSPDNSLSGGTRRVIAPVSNSGNPGSSAVNPQGDEVMLLKEYRHKSIERYFLTTRASDQQMIETGVLKNSLSFTGNTFSVYKNQIAGSSPLCRFYNSVEQTHLYTADQVECNQLKAIAGMSYEGVEGYVININKGASCPANTVPVYKAYDNTSALSMKRHRLTADFNLVNRLVRDYKWVYDSIGFCVSQLSLVDSQITTPVPTNPIVTNPPASGADVISCSNNLKYSSLNQLVTQICATQHTCVRLNGVMLGSTTGQSACDDQFGPCAECSSSTVNVSPTNPTPSQLSCSLNGNTIAHGASVTAYQSASATTACVSQQRVCANGNLSGSYAFSSCTVNGVTSNPQPPVNPGADLCPPGVVTRRVVAGDPYSWWYSERHPGTRPYVVIIDVPDVRLEDTQGVIKFSPKAGPGAREYTVSRTACDFAKPIKSYGYDHVDFNYNNPSPNLFPHQYNLSPGRWYLNLRSVEGVCGDSQTCTMNMQFQP